jgi:hypothetical protein
MSLTFFISTDFKLYLKMRSLDFFNKFFFSDNQLGFRSGKNDGILYQLPFLIL